MIDYIAKKLNFPLQPSEYMSVSLIPPVVLILQLKQMSYQKINNSVKICFLKKGGCDPSRKSLERDVVRIKFVFLIDQIFDELNCSIEILNDFKTDLIFKPVRSENLKTILISDECDWLFSQKVAAFRCLSGDTMAL